MVRNWILISIISAIFVSAISGAYFLYQKRVTQAELTPPPLPTPESGFLTSPNPEATPTAQKTQNPQGDVLGSQPNTGGPEIQSEGIVINSPQRENALSPLAVSGWTKISSGQLIIRIKDQNGNVLGETVTRTCSSFEVCSFNYSLYFANSTTQTGILEISSPADQSSEEYLASTVVQFD